MARKRRVKPTQKPKKESPEIEPIIRIGNKYIHKRITNNDRISDVIRFIKEFEKKFPDRSFFFDGDEFAICSVPKKKVDSK